MMPLVLHFRGHNLSSKRNSFYVAGTDVTQQIESVNGTANVKYLFNVEGIPVNLEVLRVILFHIQQILGSSFKGTNLVLSEVPCIPKIVRQRLLNTLSQDFKFSRILTGVGCLFAYEHISQNVPSTDRNSIVVSSSQSFTTVIPIVQGEPLWSLARRLPYSLSHACDHLVGMLALKYPEMPMELSPAAAEDILLRYGYVPLDFEEELERIANDDQYFLKIDKVFEFPEPARNSSSGEPLSAKVARGRQLMTRRALMEVLRYAEVDSFRLSDPDVFQSSVQDLNHQTIESFDEAFHKLKVKAAGVVVLRNMMGESDMVPREVASLELPLDHPQAIEYAENRIKAINDQASGRSDFEILDANAPEEESPAQRLQRIKELRHNVIQKLRRHRARRKEAKRGRRNRDYAGLEKLTQLATRDLQTGDLQTDAMEVDKPGLKRGARKRRRPDEDTFGADDKDWEVYKEVGLGSTTGAAGDDDEEQNAGLLELIDRFMLDQDANYVSEELKAFRESAGRSFWYRFRHGLFDESMIGPSISPERLGRQIHINVERSRAFEVFFRPYLYGIESGGLTEMLSNMAAVLDIGVRSKCLQDIVLVGVGSSVPGFAERLEGELRQEFPHDAKLGIRKSHGKDPFLDAWQGMATIAREEKKPGELSSAADASEVFHRFSNPRLPDVALGPRIRAARKTLIEGEAK